MGNKLKNGFFRFINYIKKDTRRKLSVLCVCAVSLVLIFAAAAEAVNIIRSSDEPPTQKANVNLDKITDGTENGVNIIKRVPKQAEKKKTEPKKEEEDLESYRSNYEDAKTYVESQSADGQIEEMIASMSLSDMVYQMMFVTPEALSGEKVTTNAKDELLSKLSDCPVGGIILFSDNIENPEQVKNLTSNFQNASKIPLFIGVDEEGGKVSRIASNPDMGMEKQPSAAEIGSTGSPDNAYTSAKYIAESLKELGINLDFAPVADVASNEKSQIGDRAFSVTSEGASPFVEGFVEGLNDAGVASVLKHFPGIGAVSSDTHEGRAELTESLDFMRKNNFLPFKAGINSGAEFVMVSHACPTSCGIEAPSSLSGEVVDKWLREELNFSGVIITDSLSMKAITNDYTPAAAAYLAVCAGCDMLLMPKNLDEAHQSILSAVASGEIPKAKLEASLRRILKAKKSMGLIGG